MLKKLWNYQKGFMKWMCNKENRKYSIPFMIMLIFSSWFYAWIMWKSGKDYGYCEGKFDEVYERYQEEKNSDPESSKEVTEKFDKATEEFKNPKGWETVY